MAAVPSPRFALTIGRTYLILIHVVLLVLVFKTDFLHLAGKTLGIVPPEEWTPDLVSQILIQAELDKSVPPGCLVLIGDSAIARLQAGDIASDAVNFGIGGDTTRTMSARLPVVRSIQHSRGVVMEVGVNDLKYRSIGQIALDYASLLQRVPASQPIYVVSVLPVDEDGSAAHRRSYLRNARITALNGEIGRVCEMRTGCKFVDASTWLNSKSVFSEDGWHLSDEGNRILAERIRAALRE